MKKIIAILLCLMLMLGAVSAMAEQAEKLTIGSIDINGAFTLKCGVPEGYQVTPIITDRDHVVASIASEDPEKPVMMLSVAFDEAYSEVERMNDLTEEELVVLENTFTDVDPTVEISYGDTGLGTRLMIAKQTEGDFDYIDFLSIYKGYFIEFALVPSETAADKTLTDEQMQVCIDFLTDLDFVPMDKDDARPTVAGMTWIAELSGYDAETDTVQAVLKRTITLPAEEVEALQVGDTLHVGQENIVIETLEKLDDGEILINDEITLRNYGGEMHVYFYEKEYLEAFETRTLKVPDTVSFMDGVDPETGDPLDEEAKRTADEFRALLAGGKEMDPGFDADNVYVSFDDNEEMVLVQRFYAPWQ